MAALYGITSNESRNYELGNHRKQKYSWLHSKEAREDHEAMWFTLYTF